MGPPERVTDVATFSHACEGELIAMVDGDRVPLLARMVYTANKQLIGKVDDVFGPMHSPGICVKIDGNAGVKAESFKAGDKVSVHNLSFCDDPRGARKRDHSPSLRRSTCSGRR